MSGMDSEAQTIGVVFDMETRRPLSGVKMYLNPKGLVITDRKGRFAIASKYKSMTFTHPGYESRSLHRSEMRDTVWLMPKMHTLDEVVILGKKPRAGVTKGDIRRYASHYGTPSSGASFDFFSAFDKSQKHKSGKAREKYRKMLENY